MLDPMPMMTLFDRQITLRMGQANVRRWFDDILPLLTGEIDPLGVDDFARHIACRWPRRRTPIACSRPSRTAPSRSSSAVIGVAGGVVVTGASSGMAMRRPLAR